MTACFLLAAPPMLAESPDVSGLLQSVDALSTTGWRNAEQIWDWAEPGYQETRSSELLSDWMQSAGFRVERGVCGMPTAFVATIGQGRPVIAILGEYDALPGLSQQFIPEPAPREDGNGYGHGCGHHLFGVASAMAAQALGRAIQSGQLPGTVKYFGCPAEEGGSAKAFMVRDGLFQDVDVALHWHPASVNGGGDRSSLARIAVKFQYHGRSAHAAGAPEQGRSALDAVELLNFGVQLMREHMPETARVHYVITHGGEAPNVVPNFAEAYYYVRHPSSQTVRDLYARLLKCAEAGALATETELKVVYEGGICEIVPNLSLSEVALRRLQELNRLHWAPHEQDFTLRMRDALPRPRPLESIEIVQNQSGEVGRGSTDVGDVSWVTPTVGFNVACWVPGTPGHSWQAVACGKTDLARQGMILAAKVLATTGAEILSSPDLVQQAKDEHQRRLGDQHYAPLILQDQTPPLNYRKAVSNRAE